MNSGREVVIVSGVRTAIGDYGGSLKDIAPTDLGARVVREAVARAKVDPAEIGQCVIGGVIHTEPKDMYLSRVAAVQGGLPVTSGALTVNRLCGSGLQAIVTAAPQESGTVNCRTEEENENDVACRYRSSAWRPTANAAGRPRRIWRS